MFFPLFSIFVFYFVSSVFVYCFVYCFSFCIQLSLYYFYTILSTTATGWKHNCSTWISYLIYTKSKFPLKIKTLWKMQALKEHHEDTSFDIFIAVKFRIPAMSKFIFLILILVYTLMLARKSEDAIVLREWTGCVSRHTKNAFRSSYTVVLRDKRCKRKSK